MSERRQELERNLAEAQQRIAQACIAAGRARNEVQLVAVTKTWPAEDVVRLCDLGVRHFGESREQEGHAKWGDVQGPRELEEPIVWHFVGRLQSNKAARIGEWADVIHSVDRESVLGPLTRAGRHLEALIQVSLDGDPTRGGVRVDQLVGLAEAIVASGLVLRGVMGVAPLGVDPRPAFELLRAASESLQVEHPDARWISAGMSGDLEEAIACGATHVRLGTSILGSRY